MEERTISLAGKEFPIRMSRRAAFRLSAMGYQDYDPTRSMAWLCAMVAAMIDTPRQLFSAEEVFEHVADLGEDEASEIFGAVMAAAEDAQPKKKRTGKPNSGHGSGLKRGSRGKNT